MSHLSIKGQQQPAVDLVAYDVAEAGWVEGVSRLWTEQGLC